MNDERFEELCALAAIGELSAAEFAELNEHLPGCSSCREIYFDFQRLASNELGVVAAGRRVNEVGADLDEPALLKRLLERAQAETHLRAAATNPRTIHEPRPSPFMSAFLSLLRGPILGTAAVILLLCTAVGIGAYRLRDRQLSPAVAQLNSQLSDRHNDAEAFAAQARSTSALLQQSQSERETLQSSLAEARRNYADLLNQEKSLQAELAAARSQLDVRGRELQLANDTAQHSDNSVKDLQTRLQDALVRVQTQETLVDQLGRKLHRAEQEATVAANTDTRDTDAQEVFGARDLHIVDVYDVDGSGKTKRSFGRVYFVEKKLLLFYAFDLQDKQRQRVAAAFQAWGYRQGNEGKPQNLGLFLMDDPAVSRWVLKVNNARVLERVDAVFVTLEPPNGSTSPSGRKLLYANLGGPPNHP